MFLPFLPRLRSRLFGLSRQCSIWHALLAGTLLLGLAMLVLSKPLADWVLPDSRIQQLLQRGEAALAQGYLSASDGSGARDLFETAKALDGDRHEARDGLLRTGQAALVQARIAFDRGQLDVAERYLRLARELQMPQEQVDALERIVRRRQAEHAGLDQLLVRAEEAYAAGRLEGDSHSALPLYQRVLELVPGLARALEGREDVLTELLRQAYVDLERGRLDAAAAKLDAAQRYDPGHVDLPQTQDLFNRAIDVHLRRAVGLLRRGRLAPAARDFGTVLAVRPEQSDARRGLEQVVEKYVAQAGREAAEFRFEHAEVSLARARALLPGQVSIHLAEQALQRARQTQSSAQPKLSKVTRERHLCELMGRFEVAESRQGGWLRPVSVLMIRCALPKRLHREMYVYRGLHSACWWLCVPVLRVNSAAIDCRVLRHVWMLGRRLMVRMGLCQWPEGAWHSVGLGLGASVLVEVISLSRAGPWNRRGAGIRIFRS